MYGGNDTVFNLMKWQLLQSKSKTHTASEREESPVRLAYQPPASSTFLSQQTSHQQPVNSTLLSERTNTSHQPTEKAGAGQIIW
jgi:hypothetical protein